MSSQEVASIPFLDEARIGETAEYLQQQQQQQQ